MTSGGRWRSVGALLALGAAYDLLFGVAILGFVRPLASFLGLQVPSDPLYLDLNAVFLFILAAVYATAARQPERYRLVAPVAGIGRTLGFLFFFRAWAGGRPTAFLVLGLADLAIGLATLIAWRRADALSH